MEGYGTDAMLVVTCDYWPALQALILAIIRIKPEDLLDIRQRSLFILASPTSKRSID